MKNSLMLFIAFLAFTACSKHEGKKNIAITGIDSTLRPGNDFFKYVNGKWYDSVQIPASQAGVGTYMFMNFPQRMRLQGILDSISQSKNKAGTIAQKVGDFYASGMDTLTIDKRGYTPIKPLLSKIEAISDLPSLMNFVVDEAKVGNPSIIAFWVSPDQKNSSMNIAEIYQTGIGLPDRDYYFKSDSSTVAIQQAYKKYLATLFQQIGSNAKEAEKNANLVYDIDKQLAISHKTKVELRDVQANYNKMAVADLVKRHPNIDWTTFLNKLGAKTDSINAGQIAYYDTLNKLLKTIPLTN
ncbi:M13 family peptidase, partial [Flavobacterium sp. LBUM151]